MHPIIQAAVLAAALTAAPHAPAAGTAETWSVEVSTVNADDANVTWADDRLRLAGIAGTTGIPGAASAHTAEAEGVLTIAPHRLRAPSDRVTVTIDADLPAGTEVLADVRGRRADGTYTEWTPSPAGLAEPAVIVQVRLTLRSAIGASPVVRSARATAAPATAARASAEPATAGTSATEARIPLTFRVFATREGLVGHTTANGHVIVERDHFVALPSRRGLSTNGAGDYSVMVCAANGRCAWAPVWDVGPWNTRDDYWNPGAVRQMWTDLPHGTPQAQAAYQHGYNGGKDQYNRQVRNPAGIDLADGTFWDALGLTGNAWVTVTYLWTGAGARTGTVVTNGGPLSVRDRPGTENPPVGLAGNHAQVHVECQRPGPPATGTQGTSDRWLHIAPGRYVSRAFVAVRHEAPDCS